MKGTAILFKEDQKVTFIEDIDHSVFEELEEQTGSKQCRCKLKDKVIDFGSVSPVYWHENEVDWEYGY
jgi:hypothetical protein